MKKLNQVLQSKRAAVESTVQEQLEGAFYQTPGAHHVHGKEFGPPSQYVHSPLPRIDFPRFDGSNPRAWVLKCSSFFQLMPNIHDAQRINLAILHFDGRSFSWIQNLNMGEIEITWKQFLEVVCARFEKLTVSNMMVELNELKQIGSYEDYVERFEELRAYILLNDSYRYSEDSFVASFLSGLSEELQEFINLFQPTNLEQTIELGRKHQLITFEAVSQKLQSLDADEEIIEDYISQVEPDFIEVVEVEDKSVEGIHVKDVEHERIVIELKTVVPSFNLRGEIILNLSVNELLLKMPGWRAPKRNDGIGVPLLENELKWETNSEILTTSNYSEIACLALYLMYVRKQGKKSFWYLYIKELNRERGRGQLAVESPLLWSDAELEYLMASPLMAKILERVEGINREYNELDIVWFMAGSLFQQYPFYIPTEAFPFEIFKQAFVAIQSCVVHLQGVSIVRRLALVSLRPPLLSYKSNCKAMLTAVDGAAQLVVDRPYKDGKPIDVWCGPKPNSRFLINYDFVDEDNKYDPLVVEAALNTEGPQYLDKRLTAHRNKKASLHSFQVVVAKENEAVMDVLLYLRLRYVYHPSEILVQGLQIEPTFALWEDLHQFLYKFLSFDHCRQGSIHRGDIVMTHVGMYVGNDDVKEQRIGAGVPLRDGVESKLGKNANDGLNYVRRKSSSLDPRGRGSYQPGGIVMDCNGLKGNGEKKEKEGLWFKIGIEFD